MNKYFSRILQLYKNFLFNLRLKGYRGTISRVFQYIKGRKYFLIILKLAQIIKKPFLVITHNIRSKYRKKKYKPHYQKRLLKKPAFSKEEFKNQIEELIVQSQRISLPHIARRPLVSIIILNRDGISHLKRLMKSISENTVYTNFEVIIIDNDSSDASVEYLKKNEYNLPIKIIQNINNVSFSHGCNQGVEAAVGDLFIFMNNDIQPFYGWITHLVQCYFDNQNVAGSIGARLIYPEKEGFHLSNRLQHAGIKFEFDYLSDFYRPYNFGAGDNVLEHKKNREFPALTAALLLVPKERFEEVGGFDEEYFYGYEDVDLGLKLNKAGYRNIFCANSIAFHYEFGTQEVDDHDDVKDRRQKNMELFKKKWDRFLVKKIFREQLYGKKTFCEEKLNVCIVPPSKKEKLYYKQSKNFIDEIKDNSKWNINILKYSLFDFFLVDRAQILLSFNPHYDISIIKCFSPKLMNIAHTDINDYHLWENSKYFTNFNFVLVEGAKKKLDGSDPMQWQVLFFPENKDHKDKLKRVINAIDKDVARKRIAIKIPAQSWEDAKKWGDYYFALSIEKYFRRDGWSVLKQFYLEWENTRDRECDAVLVIRGLEYYKTKDHHFNMMWNISHPDAISLDEYSSYNQVFIASDFWAEKIKSKLKNVDVTPLLQCTDHEIFKIPESIEVGRKYEQRLLFVGNSLRRYRTSVRYAIENNLNPSVFGPNWNEFIDKKYIKSEYIPNNQLYKYYYSSKILLNDHWDDMSDKGFVSNRVFDALASGAVILTDWVEDFDEEVLKFVNIYRNEKEFVEKSAAIMNNYSEYKNTALSAREFIVKNHSFQKRVDDIIKTFESKSDD